MKDVLIVAAAALTLILLTGCQSDGSLRYEGVTSGAGEAVAANTVMQMVDPWPRGVQDTDLVTPADLDQYTRETSADEEAEYPDMGSASTE